MITDAFGTPLEVGDKVTTIHMPLVWHGEVIRDDLYEDSVKIRWNNGTSTWSNPWDLCSENTDGAPSEPFEYTTPGFTPDYRTEDDV